MTAAAHRSPAKARAPSAPAAEAVRGRGLKIRVEFGAYGFLGPGKIALMELIARHGSIRSAGKEMGMSYRRAWLLVDEINAIFKVPLVETQMGGSGGGGARLSEFGREVVERFRAIEAVSARASAEHIAALQTMLAPHPPVRKAGKV